MWGEQEFIDFMRTGNRPEGSSVEGEAMLWKDLSVMLAGPMICTPFTWTCENLARLLLDGDFPIGTCWARLSE
jgi:hypothetical protein